MFRKISIKKPKTILNTAKNQNNMVNIKPFKGLRYNLKKVRNFVRLFLLLMMFYLQLTRTTYILSQSLISSGLYLEKNSVEMMEKTNTQELQRLSMIGNKKEFLS